MVMERKSLERKGRKMNISKNKNCNIRINNNVISNKSAKEMFEELGFNECRIEETFFVQKGEKAPITGYCLTNNTLETSEESCLTKMNSLYDYNQHEGNYRTMNTFLSSRIPKLNRTRHKIND